MTKSNGYMYKKVRTSLHSLASVGLVLLVLLAFSACKAESKLTIKLQDFSSGKLEFELKVDEEAASVIRNDAFTKHTFNDIFETEKLKKAGFKVDLDENTSGEDTSIKISKSFKSEDELKNALTVIASEDVINATLEAKRGFFSDDAKLDLTIDLSNLRDQYLSSENKEKIDSLGYDWEDYKTLIDKGFESTKLQIVVQGSQEQSKAITTDSKESLSAETSNFRIAFFLSLIGGAACLAIGIVMFTRLRHTGTVSFQSNKGIEHIDEV